MKITRSYLKQVIKEELNKLTEGKQTVSLGKPTQRADGRGTIPPGMYYAKPSWSGNPELIGLYTLNDNYEQHVGDVNKKDLH